MQLNIVTADKQAIGRLAVLLALPIASMFFSLMAWPMVKYGSGPIEIAGAILFVAAGFAGGAGFLTGGAVLVAQLIRNRLHMKNTVAFITAWVLSVLIFVAAITASTWDTDERDPENFVDKDRYEFNTR
jgi:hypothetical protein